MSNLIFPKLIGEGWPVGKKPKFSTIVHRTSSGKQIRIPSQSAELLTFDLPYTYLSDADVQQMYGFFCARMGAWDSFLFDDVTDHDTVANALAAGLSPTTGQNVIATGDGHTTTFQLTRALGGSVRAVYDINGIIASYNPPTPTVTVYVNGVAQASGWTVSNVGVLTFTSAPAAGQPIAADFKYFWRCHFADDSLDFSNFAQSFWEAKKVLLEQQ